MHLYKPDLSAMTVPTEIEAKKASARSWFEILRDDICAAFEALEDDLPTGLPHADLPPGRFERTPWSRGDHTSGDGPGPPSRTGRIPVRALRAPLTVRG